ncbi:hypothetical protein [Halioglobus sp. Uisw_031]
MFVSPEVASEIVLSQQDSAIAAHHNGFSRPTLHRAISGKRAIISSG